MLGSNKEKFLKDQQVRQEIERYKWIESEKAGHDIGFDKAADDWLKLHAKEWESKKLSPTKKSTRSAKKFI
jgi:hypothetical protein